MLRRILIASYTATRNAFVFSSFGSRSDGGCKVVQVVAFEVEESPFHIADPLPQGVLAQQGVDRIGIATTLTYQEKLLFCQLLFDIGHGGFLFVHLVLEVVDT